MVMERVVVAARICSSGIWDMMLYVNVVEQRHSYRRVTVRDRATLERLYALPAACCTNVRKRRPLLNGTEVNRVEGVVVGLRPENGGDSGVVLVCDR